jgi:hypothetical protein
VEVAVVKAGVEAVGEVEAEEVSPAKESASRRNLSARLLTNLVAVKYLTACISTPKTQLTSEQILAYSLKTRSLDSK